MEKLELALMFFLGFFSCAIIFLAYLGWGLSGAVVSDLTFDREINAPSNWISDDNVIVLRDEIILKVSNATISRYANSGSMEPFLDENSLGIRIVPLSEVQINVGDIVSFRRGGILVVHRVVERSVDGEGVYFITKGDNSDFDDGKIRFEDIEYVLVGVLY